MSGDVHEKRVVVPAQPETVIYTDENGYITILQGANKIRLLSDAAAQVVSSLQWHIKRDTE